MCWKVCYALEENEENAMKYVFHGKMCIKFFQGNKGKVLSKVFLMQMLAKLLEKFRKKTLKLLRVFC